MRPHQVFNELTDPALKRKAIAARARLSAASNGHTDIVKQLLVAAADPQIAGVTSPQHCCGPVSGSERRCEYSGRGW